MRQGRSERQPAASLPYLDAKKIELRGRVAVRSVRPERLHDLCVHPQDPCGKRTPGLGFSPRPAQKFRKSKRRGLTIRHVLRGVAIQLLGGVEASFALFE